MIRPGALATIAAGILLSLAPAMTAAAAAPAVRMLFVGIDHYTNGIDHRLDGRLDHPHADPTLHDLNGAVNDVSLIKSTLAKTYGLPVGAAARTPCWTSSAATAPVSITLLDGCATRQGVLGALVAQIAAADVNSIVLFYYAGHGSSHAEVGQDQATGLNSTLVPADAWREPGEPDNDILDVELRAIIDAAEARGVTVVTIFDSCHSGTATRDIASGKVKVNPLSRSVATDVAPPPAPFAFQMPPPGPSAAPPTPYRVHMAAASDDQDAQETLRNGVPHGIFTLALTDALTARKGATYLEIAQETLWRLQQSATLESLALGDVLNDKIQTSQAEGPLAIPFLGRLGDEEPGYLAVADPGGKDLTIGAGGAVLITKGSRFEVHAFPRTDAILGAGTVTAVTDTQATLTLDGTVTWAAAAAAAAGSDVFAQAQVGKHFWVEETWHDYGDQRLKVAIEGGADSDRALVASQLATVTGPRGYAEVVCDAAACPVGQQRFIISLADGRAEFQTADGEAIVSAGVVCGTSLARRPGVVCAADSARRLAAVTKAAANYFALRAMALANHKSKPWGEIDVFPGGCPPPTENCQGKQTLAAAPVMSLPTGDVDIYLTNVSDHDVQRYALLLSPDDFSVTVLSPPGYSDDPAMKPGDSLDYPGVFGRPGRATLLVLLTQHPINVASLHQEPVRDVDSAANNDLERLLLHAAEGEKGDPPKSGDFDVMAVDFEVTPAHPRNLKGPSP